MSKCNGSYSNFVQKNYRTRWNDLQATVMRVPASFGVSLALVSPHHGGAAILTAVRKTPSILVAQTAKQD